MSVGPSPAPEEETRHYQSQLPRALELLADAVEYHRGIIALVLGTIICLVLSGMLILRQRIAEQEAAHRNCKNKNSDHQLFGGGCRGRGYAVVEKQPVSRPIVFSENVPESVLDTMPDQRAEIIRAEKQIARNLDLEQKAKEMEVQRQQLEAIFKLMSDNKEKFGEASFEEVRLQAAMYGR